MAKTLIGRLKENLKRGILIGATVASIGLTGCQQPNNPLPQENYKPQAVLSVNPQYGKNPLNVEIKADGTDENGNQDIKNYSLKIDVGEDGIIDETFSDSKPIDITRTFNTGKVKIYETVTDMGGLSDEKDLEVIVSASDLPTVDLSSVNSNLIDGKTSTINLPNPTDDDTSGIIPYTKAEVLSGNATATLNGNNLILNANRVSQDNPYQVRLTFGTPEGGMNTATLSGTIKNLCDISGVLQDVETHSNQAGIIRLYDASNNSQLGEDPTSDGNFSFESASPVSQIKLQAQFGDSYIRTITLDGTKDYSGISVRAVSAPNFSVSKTDFITFMRQINFGDPVESNYGLKRWDLSQLQGIEILAVNPLNSNYSFTQSQQDFIANKITAGNDTESYDIRNYVRGKDLSGLIHEDTTPTGIYTNDLTNGMITPKPGWIVVVVDNSDENPGGLTDKNIINNKITGALIRLRTESINDNVVSHEFGHVFIAPIGEANNTVSSIYSIMWSGEGNLTKPGVADIKEGQIIYEDSYLPAEKLDDILGMNWMN